MEEHRVRRATPDDAVEASLVLRRSITELCVADHRNDAATLDLWLRNKTEPEFRRWLADPGNALFVEEAGSAIRGVGCVHRSGDIRLLYVRPGAKGRGVGGRILGALEDEARAWSVERLFLNSSVMARGFYERHGYVPAGEPTPGFGVTVHYPYEKRLR